MTKIYQFEVEIIEAGQRGPYQDSFYAYKVKSDLPEHIIRSFCMNVLKKSYEKKDMPNPFAGQLLRFEKVITKEGEVYYDYRTTELYTG